MWLLKIKKLFGDWIMTLTSGTNSAAFLVSPSILLLCDHSSDICSAMLQTLRARFFFSNNLFIPSLRRLFLGLAHSGQKNCILLTEELFVEKLSGARQILGHVSWFKPQGKYKFLLLTVQLGYNGYPFCRWGIWSVNTRMSSPRII